LKILPENIENLARNYGIRSSGYRYLSGPNQEGIMEHLARELARLAWQLQRDAEDIRGWANEANRSGESDESVESALGRIEARLGTVHGQTSELIRRVPSDLGQVLADLKNVLLVRLGEFAAANQSIESSGSVLSCVGNQPNHLRQSPASAAMLLTPQERRIFQLCFQSGFLSYHDIATHLDITPTAAKNLVNRMFQSDQKRILFAKQQEHGTVRVGIQPEVKGRMFGGRDGQSEPEKRTSTVFSAGSSGTHHPPALAAMLARHGQNAGR
jgi:DNA-binding CsgD family transcriptional regulator